MSAKVLSNLESVGELIGALAAMEEVIEEDSYTEELIREGHAKARDAFDVAAAATASTGRLSHVYEFGTIGITRGPVKFQDPTSAAARLWEHRIEGTGGDMSIEYSFRPALQRNPQPTTRDTGVPSKYLRKLSKRKYVFWNKAFVMETGMEVEIRSNQPHGLLFVPFNGAFSQNPRGYMMWNTRRLGNRTVQPGRETQGNFTALWINWWGTVGGEIIENSMRKRIAIDTDRTMKNAAKRANATRVKPAAGNNPMSVAKRSKFAAMKDMERGGA